MNPNLLHRTNRLLNLFSKHHTYAGTYAWDLYEILVLKDIREKDQTLIFEAPVLKFQTNNIGSVHGGCFMTYVDIVTTVGIWTFSKTDHATTSSNISTDFLSAGMLGDTLWLEAKIEKIGKKLAFSSAFIYSSSTGQLLAKGNHTKAFLSTGFQNIEP